jgi:hypothetical protein
MFDSSHEPGRILCKELDHLGPCFGSIHVDLILQPWESARARAGLVRWRTMGSYIPEFWDSFNMRSRGHRRLDNYVSWQEITLGVICKQTLKWYKIIHDINNAPVLQTRVFTTNRSLGRNYPCIS